jgi:hypothetical protein
MQIMAARISISKAARSAPALVSDHNTSVTVADRVESNAIPDLELNVYSKLHKVETASKNICKGAGLRGLPHCVVTCPRQWASLAYNSVTLKGAVKKYIGSLTGGTVLKSEAAGMKAVQDVNPVLGTSYRKVLADVAKSQVETMDNNAWHRATVTLLLGAASPFSKLTGLDSSSFCHYHQALEEMKAHDGYEVKHPKWFSSMFTCPGSLEGVSPEVPQDSSKVGRLLESLAYVYADDLKSLSGEDEAFDAERFKGVPVPEPECVLKLSRDGNWEVRELSVRRGALIFKPSKHCVNEGIFSGIQDALMVRTKHQKRLALHLVTRTELSTDVTLASMCQEDHACREKQRKNQGRMDCLELITSFRRFVFCKQSDSSAPRVAGPNHLTPSATNSVKLWHEAVLGNMEILSDANDMAGEISKISRMLVLGTKVPESGAAGAGETVEALQDAALAVGPDVLQNEVLEDVEGSMAEVGSSAAWRSSRLEVSRAMALLESDEHPATIQKLLGALMRDSHKHPELSSYLHGSAVPADVASLLQVEDPVFINGILWAGVIMSLVCVVIAFLAM